MMEDGKGLLVRVDIPDVKAQKCVVVDPNDTVWAAKQVVLDKLNQDLPKNDLNYSLYLPTGTSGSGKLGKFLDDGRMLADYVLEGRVPRLEMRYKQRDYSQQVSLTEKAIAKANTKANQRRLVEHIVAGSVKKIEKLLEQGLDPNFVTEDGNTPLGLVCGRHSHVQCIMPLLSGGAHIDFRGKDGLTPLHRAAIGGNSQAVKILLSLGASPNYRDAKGLTPLYHTAIMGDDTGACEALLRHRAETGIKDQGGWTELHQTSKYGHLNHVNLFIRYKADINAQNLVGNTPLHVAVSHGQMRCAMLLLKRGADKMKLNFSNQSPSQVAILCGHHTLATNISSFSVDQIEPISEAPVYNANARRFDPKLFVEKKRFEVCPISPPVEVLVGTLTEDWEESYQEGEDGTILFAQGVAPMKRKGSISGRPSSASSHASSSRMQDNLDTESCSSHESAGTPYQTTPVVQQPPPKVVFQQQRERLYRAGPGRYHAIQDVEPQQPGDLALRKGMQVEVLYIGKGGYWEGKVGVNQGWFPALAITESGERQLEEEYRQATTTTPNVEAFNGLEPQREVNSVAKNSIPSSNTSKRQSNIKEVVVIRGSKGYGFAMRGVKATKAMKFHPSPQVPALQYVGSVEEGGAADLAGLRTGEFIIEVNNHDVTYSTHDEVVNIVRKAGQTLTLKVISPLTKQKSISTVIKEQLTPVSTPEQLRRFECPKAPVNMSGSSHSLDEIQESTPDLKETVIEGGSRRFRESPVLARIDRRGWDSSQSQEEESPIQTNKYAFLYHVPPTLPLPASGSTTVKSYPIPSPKEKRLNQPGPEKGRNAQLMKLHQKSATLPRLPPRDYPKMSSTSVGGTVASDPEEEEEESEFARALRMGKEKMRNSNLELSGRSRSQTLPTSEEEENSTSTSSTVAPDTQGAKTQLSPTGGFLTNLTSQIRQASEDRNTRLTLNQPRLTEVPKNREKEPLSPLHGNSIAQALSQKIDSLNINACNDSSDEFESPKSSPAGIRPKANAVELHKDAKVTPPLLKPKPLRKANTDMGFQVPSPQTLSGENETSFPWSIKLKQTLKGECKVLKGEDSETEVGRGEDGNVNWKSILKPATMSGRVSPLVLKAKRTESRGEKASTTGNQETRQNQAGEVSSNVTEIENPNAEIHSKSNETLPQKSKKGMSLYNGSTQPEYNESAPQGSIAESIDEIAEGIEELAECMEELAADLSPADLPPADLSPADLPPADLPPADLPPPLSPTDSGNFLIADLPPPAAFTVEGAEVGESSTDDIILPPPMQEDNMSPAQPSPLPPPLPDTSPPKVPPSHFTIFQFPATVNPPQFATESRPNTTPSPNPSPLSLINQSRKTETLESSPIPPPILDTGSQDELVTGEDEVKFATDLQDTEVPPPLPIEPPPPLDMDDIQETAQAPATPPAAITPSSPNSVELAPTQSSKPQEHNKQLVDNLQLPVHASYKSPEGLSSPEQPPPRPPPPLIDISPMIARKQVDNPISAVHVAPEVSTPLEEETQEETTKQDAPFKQKPFTEWEVADVCDWLRDSGLEEHVPMFEDNEIMGEHLKDLSKDDLKELGVKKLGHQKTFFAKINQL